jgi:hypothetical protein
MGKLYFQARQDGVYRLWEIVGTIPSNQGGTNQPVEVQNYLLDFANQTLFKSPKTRGMYLDALDRLGVEVDSDIAQGIVIGIFKKVG